MTMTSNTTLLSVLALATLVGCNSGTSSVPEDLASPSSPKFTERAQLAASGRYLVQGAPQGAPRIAAKAAPTAQDWASALDVDGLVSDATLEGSDQAAAILNNLGIIKPLRGNSFVVLSTGVADPASPAATTPEPGTDLFPPGTDGDTVTLRLNVHVPRGVNRMSFQYNFLSAESPDFTGSPFNDTFSVQLIDPSDPTKTRGFSLASVNSSTFFDVSNSRAKNTGFDIYADDPSGVDTVFDGNKPDAGLTDFQAFSAPVTGDTDLQLAFTIQDLGDGILDSAVLIDAIQFSAMETLDPNPDLIVDQAGNLTGDLDALGDPTKGRNVRAAATDGATRVLLRVKVPGPGDVTFSLPGATIPDDGGLSLDGQGVRQATVNSRVFTTTAGDNYGVVVYQVPEDFNRCADDAHPPAVACPDDDIAERTIQLSASYVSAVDPGLNFDTQVDFQLKRPPVVLAHGLWSDPLDWLNMPLTSDPNFAITYTDYIYSCDKTLRIVHTGKCPMAETTAASGELLCFPDPSTPADPAKSISTATREARENMRRLGVAVTQVDLVAHGAAGIHARQYINSGAYQGDVNRLITLNTPHSGSTMADLITEARGAPAFPSNPSSLDLFRCDAAVLATAPIDPSGIDELTTAKVLALQLPSTPVPSHALFGTTTTTMTEQVATRKLTAKTPLYNDVKQIKRVTSAAFTVFGATGQLISGHDLFSTADSQKGGLLDTQVTPFVMSNAFTAPPGTVFSDSDFFHSMKHVPISKRITELLNRHTAGPLFGNFEGVAGFQKPAVGPSGVGLRLVEASGQPQAALIGGVHIASPADGTDVTAGGTIIVEVVADNGFTPASVAVVVGDSVASSDTPPFNVALNIPNEALGEIKLFAIAFGANDETALSNVVLLNARTNASLDSIRIVTQDPILFGLGTARQLGVVGRFNDGITRVITPGNTGTVYQTSNAAIATVSSNGVVTAVAPGIATVAAQNGSALDSITVTVKGNAAPFAKAGENVSLVCVAPGEKIPVQLDGLGSFDPDGDPLTFTWLEGGVEVASGPTPTIELEAGVHQIELLVSDGFSSAVHDTVKVSILGDTDPPSVTVIGDNPKTIECGTTYKDDGAAATDLCDGDLTGALSSTSHVDANAVGSYTVDYQVRDKVGLTTTASRSVLVADRTPPALSITGANPQTVECGTVYQDDGAAATDSCDGNLTAAIASASHVNASVPGSYTVDYQVHDKAGLVTTATRSVLVADRTPPTVSVIGANPKTVECATVYQDDGATASDSCDGNLTASISPVSHVDTSVSGSYTVDYQVRDKTGLAGTASRSVLVVDRTPPVISIIGANPKTMECGTSYQDDGVDAADSCDGDLTGTVSLISHVNTNVPGSYTVDYQVRDKAGVTSTASRSVLVADRTPPVVSFKPMILLFPPDDLYRSFTLSDCAQAFDTCSGTVDVNQAGAIVAIYSDEPDVIRTGDLDHDIVITGNSSFKLRNQLDKHSNGRVYEVEFTVHDNHGNTGASRSCFIGVKASQTSPPPVDDGRVFTVRP